MRHIKKEIVTESEKRMKALKSELILKRIPYRLRSKTCLIGRFYTFNFFAEYAPESMKLWAKICLSIPDA